MWDALHDAARTISFLLDKRGEGHRKCPRCRGSGLLGNAFTRPEKKVAHPNQPCWFCEGIGALPIVGLNGFVLARTTPCLKAPDKHNQPCVDVLQLNHGRLCKETCKFTCAKLGANLADLLFDLKTSPWVRSTSLGCHQQNMLDKSEASESIIQPCASESRPQPLSRFSQKDPCSRNGFLQRILDTPLVLSIVNNLLPNANLSPTPSTILVSVKQKPANIYPVLKLEGAFAKHHASHKQKALCCNVSSTITEHKKLSGHLRTRLESEIAANVVGFRRQKLQRKATKCIRDKSVKETQGAEGLLKTLKRKGEPDMADSLVQPVHVEASSRSLRGFKAHGEHTFPSDMPSRVVWLTTVAVVSRQVLLKRLIAQTLQSRQCNLTQIG